MNHTVFHNSYAKLKFKLIIKHRQFIFKKTIDSKAIQTIIEFVQLNHACHLETFP
jgi:hypothetical protein